MFRILHCPYDTKRKVDVKESREVDKDVLTTLC